MRKPFQESTVAWALERLRDPHGSKRVLVADEVGLGKTLVAQGVIEGMAAGRPGSLPLRVFYLCSSLSISHQNRERLIDNLPESFRDSVVVDNDRLSLLLEEPGADQSVPFKLFTLTPGTSANTSTGMKRERILLGHCVQSLLGGHSSPWLRQAFRVGAGEAWWDDAWREQRGAPEWFDAAVRKVFRAHADRLLPRKSGETSSLDHRLVIALRDEGRARSAVASLRSALILTVIDQLRPDLVIFDEFQRFFEFLPTTDDSLEQTDEATENDSYEQARAVIRAMLGTGDETGHRAAVLMLSATPYRLYSAQRERNSHHEELFQLAGFLLGKQGPSKCESLRAEFARYRRALESKELDSQAARDAKAQIEAILRPVMTRTERSALPQVVERRIHVKPAPLAAVDVQMFTHLLKSTTRPDFRPFIEPVWSSIPYPLQMMTTDYEFRKSAEPAPLAGKDDPVRLRYGQLREYHELNHAHPRLRSLLGELPAALLSLPWLPPTLPWWRLGGPFAEHVDQASKTLLFSRFRAVPRALATLLAHFAHRGRLNRGIVDTRIGLS